MSDSYRRFRRIDGCHPFKRAVPGGFVDYAARRCRGSEIVYFNFALAKEMGLLPAGHADRLNPDLRRAILDTFSVRIVNEYDVRHGNEPPPKHRMPGTYMATRYLQLQHPCRQGRTSGDGRSIWNGTFSSNGTTWDLSSCGTGVTRLCPATAESGRLYKTGSTASSYGCGTASLEEGLSAALMSETFHRNGIGTERTLAVIGLADGFAVNVRAGRNLLRPSHFFLYLKQGNVASLRAAVDCFIDRQVANGIYPDLPGARRRHAFLADEMARTFARVAATFEREYVFCWLDWDGDNILADGGIIDYGSVRQFGLYHREYRFDDGPRWSTTLPEQKRKARHIVQCFAQVRDFLLTGTKPPLAALARDPVLTLFDREFVETKRRLLLRNVGFDEPAVAALKDRAADPIGRFEKAFAYFEHARSARGPLAVEDGLTWNAVFSTRDLLRELPLRYLLQYEPLDAREFLRLAASSYATPHDRKAGGHRRRMATEFQRSYLVLMEEAARLLSRPVPVILGDVARRSAVINHYARITGDAALYATRKLLRMRRKLSSDAFHAVIRRFLDHQTLCPDRAPLRRMSPVPHPNAKKVFDQLIALVAAHRHGL